MFKIFVDNEEVKCDSTIELTEEFMNPSNIILNNVYPASWSIDDLLNNYYFPKDYSKCNIYKNNELYFTGIVKNSADLELNPLKPHYCSLQILDPSTLLSEGTTLDFVIADKTVSEAINQVIDSVKDYGFVAGNIKIPEEYNTLIGAYSTLDKAPFDVFQYLSQISLTRWGTRMIDENTTAIDFFSPELLENKGTINLSKEYCLSNNIESITYDYSTDDYRNKQITTSEDVFANNVTIKTLISNQYDTTFILEKKIGKVNKITVNGQEKTFANSEEKKLGKTADFYYEVGSKNLEAQTTYQAGSSIQIEYIAMVTGREITYNTSEISRITNNLNRNGTISRYENRSDVTSSDELQKIGMSYIKYKGKAEINLTIQARNDFLELGGKYKFNSEIDDLNGDYLVKTKKIKIFQHGDFNQFICEYTLTDSFDVENEINFFDNQRSKLSGNIEKGKSIDRNIDIETSETIYFSDLIIEEVQEQTNILDCELEAVL